MTLGAVLISLAALLWMSRHDPKRRRAFGQAASDNPVPGWLPLVVVLIPGVVLIALGLWAGLVIWMGAVCAFGWALIAVTPDGWRAVPQALRRWEAAFEARIKR